MKPVAILLAPLLSIAVWRDVPYEQAFTADTAGEAIATVRASCAPCGWGDRGREAAGVSISIDGQDRQTLLLVRGEEEADYRVLLGPVTRGRHSVRVAGNPAVTAASAGRARITSVTMTTISAEAEGHLAVALAPFLYARPDTVGRFSDVPLLTWYETEETSRGRRFQYSVVFSNEDGGTPADRLLATWGRTTDIEWVYRVEVDRAGRILADGIQGAEHKVRAFAGRREGRHPLLWVSTTNNMVSDAGPTRIRSAPAPPARSLRDVSRETIMDEEPWTYRVAAQELAREGKIARAPSPGDGRVRDPREYLYIEACADLPQNAALAFEAGPADGGRWVASDLGLPKFRIARSGCFRTAVAVGQAAVRGLRVRAFERPVTEGEARSAAPATIRLTRINRVFRLDGEHRPGASLLSWHGDRTLAPTDPPLEFSLASVAESPGRPDRLRQGYGGPPKRYAKAEASRDRLRQGCGGPP